MSNSEHQASIILILIVWVIVLRANFVSAQTPYEFIPDWLSVENTAYGTGCDFGDLNRDGWLDLAVSNGNDMAMMPNYIYINENGVLPNQATIISLDSLYSGHCEFGDVNNDGYSEIMVANYISPNWRPGSAQVYYNDQGNPEGLPSWVTADSIYCFRATFGDPDGDGDLDLACGTGEAYHNQQRPNLIYFNHDGILETAPGWVSADSDAAYDVQFVDIDNDGDQDLAVLTSGGPVKIYYNYGDSIETLPGWQSSEEDNGNSFDFADVNGDGYLDLGVANNTQMGGSGYFAIYYSSNGRLPGEPDWQSFTYGYGSEAAFCDIDGDDDYDFITGRWFGLIYIYLNENGLFNIVPDWSSDQQYSLVVENIVFADIDNGEELPAFETFLGDGQRKLFHLSDRYLQGIDQVVVAGVELPLTGYCYSLQDSWVSLAAAPDDSVTIFYRTSDTKDMAVSNWGGSTYIFTNTGGTAIFDGFVQTPDAVRLHQAYPNPFNVQTNFSFTLEKPGHVALTVYDLAGRLIGTLASGNYPQGDHSLIFDGADLASGVYFYRLQAGQFSDTKKMLLIK